MCIRDSVDYDFSKGTGDLIDVIEVLKKKFKDNLTPEVLARRINKLASLEHNYFLRVIPLVIKNLALRIAYIIEMCIRDRTHRADRPQGS